MERLLAIAGLLMASGCASLAQPDAPAILLQSDAAVRTELRSTVAAALGREDIVLADDALMREATLVIERAPARDEMGRRLSGRELEKPEVFRLLLQENRCVLLHERTGKRFELKHGRCVRLEN